ncbi:porin [Cognatishimia sp.]|uniref:porin n=1 Tax=Cognatishimia sp. TaxID=2211648 RepID=UPI003517B34D
MKKVLFASTALVMVAGAAAADVTVSGSANMGLFYNGTTTVVKNEIDIDVAGSGSTDGGITFGASVDLDAESNNSAHTTGTGASDPEVFISYEGLTLTVGDIGEASDQGGLADVGFDGIGIDDSAEIGAFGSHDVHVAYSFGDIAVAASIDSDSSNDDWGIGMSTSFDSVSVAVGFGSTAGANQTTATIGYSAGAFGANIFYVDNGTNTGQGIDISYTSGDLTITAVFADNDGAGTQEAYGIGFAYDLGGATLAGGFGEAKGTSVADLGVSFSF